MSKTESVGRDRKVKGGDIEIKVQKDKVSLHYMIGEKVGSAWGETFEEALRALAKHQYEDLRPDPKNGRYILPDESIPQCPNCGDYRPADHHRQVSDRVIKCSLDTACGRGEVNIKP